MLCISCSIQNFSGDMSIIFIISLVYWFVVGGIGSICCFGFIRPLLYGCCTTEGQEQRRQARIEAIRNPRGPGPRSAVVRTRFGNFYISEGGWGGGGGGALASSRMLCFRCQV